MRELLRECLIRGMFMKYGSKLTYGAHAEGANAAGGNRGLSVGH